MSIDELVKMPESLSEIDPGTLAKTLLILSDKSREELIKQLSDDDGMFYLLLRVIDEIWQTNTPDLERVSDGDLAVDTIFGLLGKRYKVTTPRLGDRKINAKPDWSYMYSNSKGVHFEADEIEKYLLFFIGKGNQKKHQANSGSRESMADEHYLNLYSRAFHQLVVSKIYEASELNPRISKCGRDY